MTDVFARIRLRAAKVIAKYGAPITFYSPGTPAKQNPNGSWTPAIDATTFDGIAIEAKGDPQDVDIAGAVAGLILKNPVIVLVSAEDASGTPMAGVPRVDMTMLWVTGRRNIKNVKPVAPNGVAIYYIVVGDV